MTDTPIDAIHTYLDAFNAGDADGMSAVFSANGSILDGMAPHQWLGPTAAADWYRDVLAEGEQRFADLMVWVDDDSDGVSKDTELHSLSSLGITQLGLNAQTSTATDNGNLIFNQTSTSSYAVGITGSGTVTKTGAGILTVTATGSSYSGGTSNN